MRFKLKTILIFEFGVVILAIIIMSMVPSLHEEGVFLSLSSMLLLAAILHLLIIPFKGLNFIMRDEDPSSNWKTYWFIVIIPATLYGAHLEKYFVSLAIFIEFSVISLLEAS